MMYRYKALVTRIYDGDTITLDIDLGLNVWLRNQSIRLYGVNTPEIRGAERPAGLESRLFVLSLMDVGSEVELVTIKDRTGKYGRWLGIIKLPDGVILNSAIVENGYGEPYMGYELINKFLDPNNY